MTFRGISKCTNDFLLFTQVEGMTATLEYVFLKSNVSFEVEEKTRVKPYYHFFDHDQIYKYYMCYYDHSKTLTHQAGRE